jgi:HlyD family secretion protein
VQSGEISQDSARVLMRALRGGAGGGRGGGQGGGAGQGGGRGGGFGAGGGFRGNGGGVFTAPAGAARPRQLRRAVVFVVNGDGKPEPRPVQIGLNDYDHTQVVSGVEEGAQVALLGAAELQAQQQEFLDRVRQGRGGFGFGGGPVFIGPGPGGGGGGGGGRGGR